MIGENLHLYHIIRKNEKGGGVKERGEREGERRVDETEVVLFIQKVTKDGTLVGLPPKRREVRVRDSP
jgi:hypothetical protein